jgi:hypothetical protein
MGVMASASFPVDIPADGVSAKTQLTLPSLGRGKYKLLVSVSISRKILGENWYELKIQ